MKHNLCRRIDLKSKCIAGNSGEVMIPQPFLCFLGSLKANEGGLLSSHAPLSLLFGRVVVSAYKSRADKQYIHRLEFEPLVSRHSVEVMGCKPVICCWIRHRQPFVLEVSNIVEEHSASDNATSFTPI
jgi:hypothetical protein